jgi:hypothetical protein
MTLVAAVEMVGEAAAQAQAEAVFPLNVAVA